MFRINIVSIITLVVSAYLLLCPLNADALTFTYHGDVSQISDTPTSILYDAGLRLGRTFEITLEIDDTAPMWVNSLGPLEDIVGYNAITSMRFISGELHAESLTGNVSITDRKVPGGGDFIWFDGGSFFNDSFIETSTIDMVGSFMQLRFYGEWDTFSGISLPDVAPDPHAFINSDAGIVWHRKGDLGYGMSMSIGELAAGPVPEPATMLLLGSGFVGLAVIGRKRFKK